MGFGSLVAKRDPPGVPGVFKRIDVNFLEGQTVEAPGRRRSVRDNPMTPHDSITESQSSEHEG